MKTFRIKGLKKINKTMQKQIIAGASDGSWGCIENCLNNNANSNAPYYIILNICIQFCSAST